MMHAVLAAALGVVLLGLATNTGAQAPGSGKETQSIDRGRYLVRIGGCNDCHTAGYPEKAGAIPESEWLVGHGVGFHGPWGTTYPSNLRQMLNAMTEAEWIKRARQPMRPPMPWFALRDMNDQDLRDIHRYVKSIGSKGEPAPAYLAPGVMPKTPYFDWNLKNLPAGAQSKP